MAKAKVDRMQYFTLIPNLLFCKAIGFTTGIFSRQIGADTWTSMLIGLVFGALGLALVVQLAIRYPDKTIIQYSHELLGTWMGKLVGIVLVAFFAVAYATSANTVIIHFEQYLLPETPGLAIGLAYVVICMFAVFLGIEVIIRFSFFALLAAVLLNVTMVLGTLGDFTLKNLLPVLDTGLQKNIATSIHIFPDVAMVLLAVAMLFPMITNKKGVHKLSQGGMIVGIILVMTWPIMEIATMGADAMKQFVVVCMQQARSAKLSVYLPRYELIMIVLWIWPAFLQSAVMFYCSLYSLKQTIGFKKDIYYLPSLTLILWLLTYYIGYDHNHFVHFLLHPWSQITALLSVGLPLLLMIVSFIKKPRKKGKSSDSTLYQ